MIGSAACRMLPLLDRALLRVRPHAVPSTPTPAPRPGPRLRRGRSYARAPTARKLCPLAPVGEGLSFC
ncbi:hypothetical protein CFBP2533_11300 [Xanthomonas hortorum pv. pelargonii]|uniref:Uncharacterized protein n=2 Tax=Xanthomonas hortorum pv. pelargonii TaxID=453602 RepID=A0A6V7CDK0_9XANT|nr:hypothetical protein CFBP2533_11300 [Xanthomonas hortorum pv. pelargonii]CAD0312851.1 hypothetical protein CFBP2533_11300 [Xanthomonas hortorum pv. pelargonii]